MGASHALLCWCDGFVVGSCFTHTAKCGNGWMGGTVAGTAVNRAGGVAVDATAVTTALVERFARFASIGVANGVAVADVVVVLDVVVSDGSNMSSFSRRWVVMRWRVDAL